MESEMDAEITKSARISIFHMLSRARKGMAAEGAWNEIQAFYSGRESGLLDAINAVDTARRETPPIPAVFRTHPNRKVMP